MFCILYVLHCLWDITFTFSQWHTIILHFFFFIQYVLANTAQYTQFLKNGKCTSINYTKFNSASPVTIVRLNY